MTRVCRTSSGIRRSRAISPPREPRYVIDKDNVESCTTPFWSWVPGGARVAGTRFQRTPYPGTDLRFPVSQRIERLDGEER